MDVFGHCVLSDRRWRWGPQINVWRRVVFSETIFACPMSGRWRALYFAPKAEVSFCGHVTIALGATLARRQDGAGFRLVFNDAEITVEGQTHQDRCRAALQSPPGDRCSHGGICRVSTSHQLAPWPPSESRPGRRYGRAFEADRKHTGGNWRICEGFRRRPDHVTAISRKMPNIFANHQRMLELQTDSQTHQPFSQC